MTTLNRRQLLQSLGALSLLSSCGLLTRRPAGFFGEKDEFIYSGYRVGEAYENTNAGMHMGSFTTNQRFKLANEIHSVVYSPKFDLKVYVSKLEKLSFSQVGDGEIFPVPADEGNYFYGHAVIDEKRGVAYFSEAKITKTRDEMDRISEPGFIYIRTLPDMKLIGRFSSHGHDPHDLKIVGDELIVCNGGQNSSIAFIDLNTKEHLRSFFVNEEHISLRHITQKDADNFIVAPLTRDMNKPCPPYALNVRTGLKRFEHPFTVEIAMMRAQILSILSYDGYTYGTCPLTDTLMVWDANAKFIGGHHIPSACNLVYSKKYGGVICGSGYETEKARLIKIIDKKVVTTELDWAKDISGAHSIIIEKYV